ncbi:glyoxylate dehydrogenase [Entophlyctis helioformis]|nr:glyoxylate dehydrogenase [Entophlyctis helioformis]
MISFAEVQKHNTAKDCWVVIHGRVFNLTPFLSEHPGGSKVIAKEAGTDATAAFDQVHPKDIIDQILPAELCLGPVDPASLPAAAVPAAASGQALAAGGTVAATRADGAMSPHCPPLDAVLNLFDFESIAKTVLTKEAWAYYSSGGDDELTLQENRAAFHRIWLRPRVLVNVKHIDMSTTMLGQRSTLPVYITATALGKLGHPQGEVVLTHAAGTRGVVQMIPTLASCTFDDMINARVPGQPQFYQLYVNSDRKLTERLVRKAEQVGIKGLFITVDAPEIGRREKDMRVKFINSAPDVMDASSVQRSQGAARAISHFIDPSLSWADIPWFRSITTMPIVLKGIQTGEDAVFAFDAGVDGIVVSNHGGRQLDTCRSGIEVLEEVVAALEAHGVWAHGKPLGGRRFEIYLDGGVRRATDIYKAIALGAKGVGLGRPFLYAMATYGQKGVERALDLLRDELEMVMRLMGVTRIEDIKRSSVVTTSLSFHAGTPLRDALANATYEPLGLPAMQVSKSKL